MVRPWIVLWFVLSVATYSKALVRDGSLRDLALLLNEEKNRELFQRWTGSMNDTTAFLSLLEPWIMAIPAAELPDSTRQRDEVKIDCYSPKYKSLFTGNKLAPNRPRIIVDFVPFGYDVDKLLLRLIETWDSVDVYVIYEMPFTLLGIYKPLLFPRIREQPRFKEFASKILYITGSASKESSLGATAEYVRNQTDVYKLKEAKKRARHHEHNTGNSNLGNTEGHFLPSSLFAMMYKFDSDIIRYFKLLPPVDQLPEGSDPYLKHSAVLKARVMDTLSKYGPSSVYGIQNDGDEIMTAHGLAHVKHCELKPEVVSIYAPCFSFKNNFHWLQRTSDMYSWGKEIRHTNAGGGGGGEGRTSSSWDMDGKTAWYLDSTRTSLNGFLWKSGPFLWPLNHFLDGNYGKGSVLRTNFTTNQKNEHHLGYGAAFHMSAVSEPAEVWMKACGTVENVDVCWRSISPRLIEAGKKGEITGAVIYDSSIKPWCHLNHPTVHIDSGKLSPAAKAVIMWSVPRVVKENPGYFPFMYPGKGKGDRMGLFDITALPKWMDECPTRKG